MKLHLYLIYFIQEIYRSRHQIYQLAKRDFVSDYVDNFFGLFWAFFQPIVMMAIMWFVFTYGFRSGNTADGVPFVVYLFTGLISWNFIGGVFGEGASVIKQHSFLLTKVDFKLFILPLVKLLSAFAIHAVFIFFLILILIINGYYPDIYWIQFFYYLFAASMLLVGTSWITSSISLFIPDVGKIIPILLQVGFWFTPIFWNLEMVPPEYHSIFKWNPFFYIVNGYRESFIYHVPFWDRPWYFIYYWSVTGLVLFTGMVVYRRLKPHFAEVA